MKTRFSLVVPAAIIAALVSLSFVLVPLCAYGAEGDESRTPAPPAARRSLPYHEPPSQSKRPTLFRRLTGNAPPAATASSEESPPPTKAPVEQAPPKPQPKPSETSPQPRSQQSGISMEKLWDRWHSQREPASRSAAKAPARASGTKAVAPVKPVETADPAPEQLEEPQPMLPPGEFPVFRAEGEAPVPISASVTQPKLAHAPTPAAELSPVPTPAELPAGEPTEFQAELVPTAPTSVMASHQSPAPSVTRAGPSRVTLRPATETTKPIAAPAAQSPLRSTAAYLADGVRYGLVIRRPATKSADPTADILGERRSSNLAPTPAVPTTPPLELETPTANEEPSGRPQSMPLEAEDVSHLRAASPTAAAEYTGRPTTADSTPPGNTSSSASPAALQRALRGYGSPPGTDPHPMEEAAPREAALEPQPALHPVPEPADDSSQRSVLIGGSKPIGIERPDSSAKEAGSSKSRSSGKPLQGSVAGVDKAHRTIRVVFPGGRLPSAGAKIQVSQHVLFKRQVLGEFRVVAKEGNSVIAQPIGKINLETILNGDDAQAM